MLFSSGGSPSCTAYPTAALGPRRAGYSLRLGFQIDENFVIAEDGVTATPLRSNSFFYRNWPLAGLIAAVVVSLAWIGFLGYGLFKLAQTAFF